MRGRATREAFPDRRPLCPTGVGTGEVGGTGQAFLGSRLSGSFGIGGALVKCVFCELKTKTSTEWIQLMIFSVLENPSYLICLCINICSTFGKLLISIQGLWEHV